ncbi:hypothetical protein ACFP3Q_00620 [Nocardioides sp. GCM10027113]|uniref:hypothetical protein n=1 Tax=unclassified Nocardioides TaxID=2615069 RepID=UPI00360E6044
MPDQLTRGRLSAPAQAVVVVAAFAAGGALAGVLWEWLWTPQQGVAIDGQWLLDSEALGSEFSGTALYVLVGAAVGLLLGVAVALLLPDHELVTLGATVVGSVLAAWLMWRVGLALDPPDPAVVARTAPDRTPVPGDLDVVGRSPFTALPTGALVGLVAVFVGFTRHRKPPR